MDEILLMGAIYQARRRKAAERLRGYGITLSQLHLIQLARRRGAISPSAAADELDLDRPTATLIAQKCVAKGWLSRRSSERDRRSSRLVLSGLGEELLDRIERDRLLSAMSLGDPLDILSPEERETLGRALARIEERARGLFNA